jgi:uncharacterized protein YukE
MSNLEKTCKELAKDLDDTLKANAENIKDYQKLLEDAQKEISTLQEYSKFWGGFAAKLNVENQKLEAKIEAANNILRYIEKDPNLFKRWKTEFQQLKEVLQFPRKEEETT